MLPVEAAGLLSDAGGHKVVLLHLKTSGFNHTLEMAKRDTSALHGRASEPPTLETCADLA